MLPSRIFAWSPPCNEGNAPRAGSGLPPRQASPTSDVRTVSVRKGFLKTRQDQTGQIGKYLNDASDSFWQHISFANNQAFLSAFARYLSCDFLHKYDGTSQEHAVRCRAPGPAGLARLRAALLSKIDLRWSWTVFSETNMCRATSRVPAPPARWCSSSVSRALSPHARANTDTRSPAVEGSMLPRRRDPPVPGRRPPAGPRGA